MKDHYAEREMPRFKKFLKRILGGRSGRHGKKN